MAKESRLFRPLGNPVDTPKKKGRVKEEDGPAQSLLSQMDSFVCGDSRPG